MKKLELIVLTNSRKSKEFKQSLNFLAGNLQNYCSSLKIDESEDGLTFNILARWETLDQMDQALNSKEFGILSGAIFTLCKITSIGLDDKQVYNDISKLSTLSIREILDKHQNRK